jgi:hypothetical protein
VTHIAIQEALNSKAVDWMEHVSDEQYKPELQSLPLLDSGRRGTGSDRSIAAWGTPSDCSRRRRCHAFAARPIASLRRQKRLGFQSSSTARFKHSISAPVQANSESSINRCAKTKVMVSMD